MRASMKWPMRAFAITGMLTVFMISRILLMGAMRATPPSRRMSEGTRSRAMTAVAPAFSAMTACSALVTSIMTPPFSISAKPVFGRKLSSRYIGRGSFYSSNQRCRLHGRGSANTFQFSGKHAAKHRNASFYFSGIGAGEAESQCAGVNLANGEVFSGQVGHAFPLSTRRQFACIQGLWQTHPEVHATARMRPGCTGRQMAAAGVQRRLQTLSAGLQHMLVMMFQPAGFGKAQQHSLRELVAMQVAPLLGFSEFLNERARPDHPTHAQTGEGQLGKTAQQNCVAALIELFERGRG